MVQLPFVDKIVSIYFPNQKSKSTHRQSFWVTVGYDYSARTETPVPEGNHVFSTEHKDTRWFSWWDYAAKHDSSWHTQALTHMMLWVAEGENPWSKLTPQVEGDSKNPTSFSSRQFAWNVAR